jgi:hypothetical protein
MPEGQSVNRLHRRHVSVPPGGARLATTYRVTRPCRVSVTTRGSARNRRGLRLSHRSVAANH